MAEAQGAVAASSATFEEINALHELRRIRSLIIGIGQERPPAHICTETIAALRALIGKYRILYSHMQQALGQLCFNQMAYMSIEAFSEQVLNYVAILESQSDQLTNSSLKETLQNISYPARTILEDMDSTLVKLLTVRCREIDRSSMDKGEIITDLSNRNQALRAEIVRLRAQLDHGTEYTSDALYEALGVADRWEGIAYRLGYSSDWERVVDFMSMYHSSNELDALQFYRQHYTITDVEFHHRFGYMFTNSH